MKSIHYVAKRTVASEIKCKYTSGFNNLLRAYTRYVLIGIESASPHKKGYEWIATVLHFSD
jgi:hypothetical protein